MSDVRGLDVALLEEFRVVSRRYVVRGEYVC